MAYCSRCGKELPQGVKYCTECGAPVPQTENGPVSGGYAAAADQRGKKPGGPLMGILAMVLGLVSLLNHVTVISVALSVAAIVLAVRCLKNRVRLKGFAIAAIVFAVLNFLTYAVPLSDSGSTGPTTAAARAVTEAAQEKAERRTGSIRSSKPSWTRMRTLSTNILSSCRSILPIRRICPFSRVTRISCRNTLTSRKRSMTMIQRTCPPRIQLIILK